MLDAIEQYDSEIERIAKQHADYDIFNSLPGTGSALTPRLMVAFGEQRERFQSAAEMQMYSGIAPVTEQSRVEKNNRSIGNAQHFCDKPLLSGLDRRLINPSGRMFIITNNNEVKDVLIK